MTTESLEIDVAIEVVTGSRITVGKAIWSPNIFIDGTFYPGRILRCDKPIPPGSRGRLVVGIIYDAQQRPSLPMGTRFELRDGPSIIIANATVI